MNPLILIGSAPCTKADFQNAVVIVETADVIGIGLDSADKCNEKFLGVVTYEPHDLPRFYQKRELMGFHEHCPSYSQEQFKGFVNHVYPELEPPQPDSQGWSGSSALLGVKVGLRLGYKKIILCGCPLDVHRYKKFQRGWLFVYDMLKDTVRSMSGWTKDLLGEPTKEWVKGK